ncbi:Ulp1 protease family protein [Colletotrichum musicola]|uniref:Ulp1 protease family protein n=1 Tax=Colletotrichum musicola TaxID=2175873 RepID=A0A8H6KTZ7_9PEZI|nr:Ulp1 protease family protein [Colletotrichum musicola]
MAAAVDVQAAAAPHHSHKVADLLRTPKSHRLLAFRSSRHQPPQPLPPHRGSSDSSSSASSDLVLPPSPSSSPSLSPASSSSSSSSIVTKSGHRSESRLSMPFRKMARHFGDTRRRTGTCLISSPSPRVLVTTSTSDGGCRGVKSALPGGTIPVVSRYPPYVALPNAPARSFRVASGAPIPGCCAALTHTTAVTYEDIKSLKSDWLTDNVRQLLPNFPASPANLVQNIAFWEEWLEREVLPKYPQARIILLRPSMTFLLMKEPDMRQIRSALPDFSRVTHIFLPINDARNVAQAEGGSHWSLLLVSAIDGVAFHYDSLGGANYSEARLATQKMSEILGRPLRFLNLEDSPQQENGSDCGVFVCILMRHLLVKRLLSANAREKVSMSMANKLIDSHGGRKEMLKIIESLRKEGERRRS